MIGIFEFIYRIMKKREYFLKKIQFRTFKLEHMINDNLEFDSFLNVCYKVTRWTDW